MQSMTGNNTVKIKPKRLYLPDGAKRGGRLLSVFAQEVGFQPVHLHFFLHKIVHKCVVPYNPMSLSLKYVISTSKEWARDGCI